MTKDSSQPTIPSSGTSRSFRQWCRDTCRKQTGVSSSETVPITEPNLLHVNDRDALPTDAEPMYTEVWICSRLLDGGGYTAQPKVWYTIPPWMSEDDKTATLEVGKIWQQKLERSTVGSWNSSQREETLDTLKKTILEEHLSRLDARSKAPAGDSSWHLNPVAYIIDQSAYATSEDTKNEVVPDPWTNY